MENIPLNKKCCLEKSNENAMDVYVCLGYENA
jgi:hypothetical protein